jgi:hypothetical protein
MQTHAMSKINAKKIKSAIDRIANVNCEISRSGKLYRISENSVNSSVFIAVSDLVESGTKLRDVTTTAVFRAMRA